MGNFTEFSFHSLSHRLCCTACAYQSSSLSLSRSSHFILLAFFLLRLVLFSGLIQKAIYYRLYWSFNSASICPFIIPVRTFAQSQQQQQQQEHSATDKRQRTENKIIELHNSCSCSGFFCTYCVSPINRSILIKFRSIKKFKAKTKCGNCGTHTESTEKTRDGRSGAGLK